VVTVFSDELGDPNEPEEVQQLAVERYPTACHL